LIGNGRFRGEADVYDRVVATYAGDLDADQILDLGM
jgi:hypothetical protein